MFDYKQLEALESVSREQTFLAASAQLHLSQPAISERIRLLEQVVGQPLLVRSNPVKLTKAGQSLLHHFEQVKMLEHGLLRNLNLSQDSEWLRLPIGVNFDSLSSWFIKAITQDVLEKSIRIEIEATHENRTLNLLREGRVLACVSSESQPITGCSSEPLGTLIYRCVAAPSLLKRRKMDLRQDSQRTALKTLPAIIYEKEDDFHTRFLKDQFGTQVKAPPYLYVPYLTAILEAIREGWGYGLVLELSVLEDLKKGRLIDLTPGKSFAVNLNWHCVQIENSLLSQISSHIVKYARKTLMQKV